MKISFRYKIQAAVLAILLITLAAYIGLASQALMKEKVAALLETTAASAEVISSRISRKLIAQEFWVEGVLAISEDQRQSRLSQNAALLSVVRKSGDKVERLFDRTAEIAQSSPPFSTPKGMAVVPRPDRNFWMIKVFDHGEVISSLWSQDLFAEEERSYSDGSLFLISTLDQQVLPILTQQNSAQTVAEELKKEALPKTLVSKRFAAGGVDYMVATNPIEYFPLLAGVAFPESIALEAVRDLQARSVYFAIFVVGLTGILAFWIGRALTEKLSLLREETAKIAQGDLDSARLIESRDEIGDLSQSIVVMAEKLKKYISEVAEKSRMEAELKTAKTVQEMLFPEKSWSDDRYEVHGYYESASECGGDLWFYWRVDRFLFFLIADATGHGAPAALITSSARSTIASAEYLREKEISVVAEMLHHSVKEASKGKILMTAWIGRLNLESGEIDYVNCSHEPVFLIGPEGRSQLVSGINNARLGDPFAAEKKFSVGKIRLEAGQKICLYTDGLCDVETADENRLSDRKFSELLVQNFSSAKPIEKSIQDITDFLKDFSGRRPLDDDMTMVVVGRKEFL